MILEVKNLTTRFKSKKGVTTAVNNVSFQVQEGEILAIVGESGSGKSVTSLSIMGLTPGEVKMCIRDSFQLLYLTRIVSHRFRSAYQKGILKLCSFHDAFH